VPIDELFDGMPPVEERAYLSNNGALPAGAPLAPPVSVASDEGRVPLMPTTTPEIAASAVLPSLSQSLDLGTTEFTAGQPFEATFTLKNNTAGRLHLEMLGVAGRDVGEASLRSDLLFFDREVILNPGREYQFKRTLTLDEAGPAELFAFALGEDNEWIPLGGASAPVLITVAPGVLTRHVYLPAMMNAAPGAGAHSDSSPPSVPESLSFAPTSGR
jgi:hypothetical protein